MKTSKMLSKSFYLKESYYWNVEWVETDGLFSGTIYVTSDKGEGVVWYSELNDNFSDSDEMLEYVEKFVKRNDV